MSKMTRKIQSVDGVAAGQTATARLPIGGTYERIFIEYGGATLAQLNGVRLLANGKTVQKITEFTKLDAINKYDGRTAAGGIIVLDLLRSGLRLKPMEELTGIGTGHPADKNPITTLHLEIDIDAAAVAPTLVISAEVSAPRVSGLIKFVREYTFDAPAAGEYEIANIPTGNDVNRVFFGGHTANVYTKLEVERDSRILFTRSVALNEQVQSDGVRVPQADLVCFDPSEEGHGSEVLATSGFQDLRYRLTVTNAGQVPVTVETLETLAQ
jgi:hypothetical protein